MKHLSIAVLCAGLVLISRVGLANMSYSPWVHEVIQNGQNMEITVQIFDESTGTNTAGEPLPGFESKYTLTRYGSGEASATVTVLKEHTFDPAEADAVTEVGCRWWSGAEDLSLCDADAGSAVDCEDCDNDGVGECYGFCGKAYQYKFIDSCPPADQDLMYGMTATPAYDWVAGSDEGLGFTTATFSGDAQCPDSSASGNCSATNIGGSGRNHRWFQSLLAMLLI